MAPFLFAFHVLLHSAVPYKKCQKAEVEKLVQFQGSALPAQVYVQNPIIPDTELKNMIRKDINMQNILEILKEMGIEVPTEKEKDINKKVSENYKTVAEHNKKVESLETERDGFKEQYDNAKATLDGFEGKDFDAITKERDEWKIKAEQAEKDAQAKLQERDYEDAVNSAVSDLKFSSNAAKKAFVSELKDAGLKLKDGKLYGLNEYVEDYKKNDATAFVTDADDNQAQFTNPMGDASKAEPITGDPNKMDFSTYKKWRSQNE